MLLADINPIITESSPALESQLEKAKKALSELKAKATSPQQSGKDSRYTDLLKKLQASVNSAKADLTAFHQRGSKEDDARAFANKLATKKAAETPEEKSKRTGASISAGMAASKETGATMTDKAAAVHKAYMELSSGGKHKVTGGDIAHKLGGENSSRIVNIWLTKPEFRKTAQLMGR